MKNNPCTRLGLEAVNFIAERHNVSNQQVCHYLSDKRYYQRLVRTDENVVDLAIDDFLSKRRRDQLNEELENVHQENIKLKDHELQLLRQEIINLRLQLSNNQTNVDSFTELDLSFSNLLLDDKSQSSDGASENICGSILCQAKLSKYGGLVDKYWWNPYVAECFRSYEKTCIEISEKLKSVETLKQKNNMLLEKLQKLLPIEVTPKEEEQETDAKGFNEGQGINHIEQLIHDDETYIKPLFEYKDVPVVREMLRKQCYAKEDLMNELQLVEKMSAQSNSEGKSFAERLFEQREHPKIKDLLSQNDSIQKQLYDKVKEVKDAAVY